MFILLSVMLIFFCGCSEPEEVKKPKKVVVVVTKKTKKVDPVLLCGLEKASNSTPVSLKWNKAIVYKHNNKIFRHKTMSLLNYIKKGNESYLYVYVSGTKGLINTKNILDEKSSKKIAIYYINKVKKHNAKKELEAKFARYKNSAREVNIIYKGAFKKKYNDYTAYTFVDGKNKKRKPIKIYGKGRILNATYLSRIAGLNIGRDIEVRLYKGSGDKYFLQKDPAIRSFF